MTSLTENIESLRACGAESQRVHCANLVRVALATFGGLEEEHIPKACEAMARGLFGLGIDSTDNRLPIWSAMVEAEYRKALASTKPKNEGGP